MKDEALEKIHKIRGSLNVISRLIRCLNEQGVEPKNQEIFEASKISLKQIVENLDALQKTFLSKKSNHTPPAR